MLTYIHAGADCIMWSDIKVSKISIESLLNYGLLLGHWTVMYWWPWMASTGDGQVNRK